MPELVTCPNCSRKLRVPDDLLGKMVKCPECKEAFVAQTEAVSKSDEAADENPAAKPSGRGGGISTGPRSADADPGPMPSLRRTDDDDHPSRPDDDEDHPSRGGNQYDDFDEDHPESANLVRAGWKKVRLGLSLLIWSIYTYLAGIFIYLLCAVVGILLMVLSGAGLASALTSTTPNASSNASAAAGTSFTIAMIVLGIGYVTYLLCVLACFIMEITGHILFLWIPNYPGTGRRPLAITQLSLMVAICLLPFISCSFYCLGVGAAAGTRNSGLMLGGALAYECGFFITFLCSIAWFFVHMFFLRSIARAMGNDGLARTLVIYMIAYPTYLVLSFVSLLVVGCLGGIAAASFASSSSSASSGGATMGGWVVLLMAVYLLILLVSLALWIWYVVILHQARGSITRRLVD